MRIFLIHVPARMSKNGAKELSDTQEGMVRYSALNGHSF